MSEKNENFEMSRFTKIAVALVMILITTLIVTKFFFFDPKGYITNGIIILTGFLIILALAEAFDQLAFGKLLTLKRNIQQKENDNKVLRDENFALRNQIVQMTTNIAQIQSLSNNVTVHNQGSDQLYEKLLDRILPATSPEVEQKNHEEEADLNQIIGTNQQSTNKKKLDWRKVEGYVIDKIRQELEMSNIEIVLNAKLTSQRTNQDVVSTHQVLFDAYFPDKEIFIEVRPNNLISSVFRDRLYVMLSKLFYYSLRLKSKKALLILVLVDIDNDENQSNKARIYNVLSEFDPAVKQELLLVRYETIEGELLEQFSKD